MFLVYACVWTVVLVAVTAFLMVRFNGGGGSSEPSPSTSKVQPNNEATRLEELQYFKTPSGNIVCFIRSEVAGCEIREKTFTPPPQPEDCEYDWGGVIELERGRTFFVCYSDTRLFQAADVLEYGSAISRGDVTCDSSEQGVRCVDAGTGRGFTLSRSAYSQF